MRVIYLLTLLLCGCSVTSGSRTVVINGQPETLTIRNTRFLWASEAIDTSITDSAGFTFSLKVQKSTVDNAALATVVSLAKEAMIAAKGYTNTPSK